MTASLGSTGYGAASPSPASLAPAAAAGAVSGTGHGGAPAPEGAAAASPFVSFEQAGFRYEDSTVVFDGFDLTVPQGQYLCLLGGNGSGKSTLAKLVDALLLPQAGAVRAFGRRTDDADELFFIRSNTGLVFQSPDDQLVASLVEDDVAFGPENLGVPAPELRQRVSDALAQVGLQGFERCEVQGLSGGQKQRVAIAGALALEPALLVLDEATAMLDPRGRASLRRVARQLHEEGLTVISITHFMEEATDAERVVVLDDGQVRLDGTPSEVFGQAEALRGLGLDVPFVAALAGLLREGGIPAPAALDDAALADALGRELQARAADRPGAPAPSPERSFSAASAKGAAQAKAPVLLSYEQVGFAYGKPPKRRSAQAQPPRPAGAAPEAPRAWGTGPDAAWALRDVTFELREGEALGLAGHTGSGKSTLIQTMNGLRRATEGTVRFRGDDLADKAVAARARTAVGVVFQYPETQLFAPSVYDDVAFGPRNLGLGPEAVDARVRAALEAVALPYEAVYARSPFELSGGQQRRVALAGVLAMEPEALVLDEPAAGLDPRGRRGFLALLRRLHDQGMTMAMASHSMEDLATLCDYLLVLEGGSIARRGAPAEVFADAEALHALGLAPPAPDAFAALLRQRGFALPRPLYDVEGLADDIAANLRG